MSIWQSNIPSEINSGDSLTWVDAISNCPASSYSLMYAIRGSSTLDLTAVAEGDNYITTIPASQSSLLTPGSYFWQAVISQGSIRVTVGNGSLEVIRDLFSTGGGYDGRTEAQKLLDAVSEAIVTITNGGMVQSYSIKGRSLTKYTLTELIQLRDRVRAEVAREQTRAWGQDRRVYVRFDRPS